MRGGMGGLEESSDEMFSKVNHSENSKFSQVNFFGDT